MAFDAAVNIKLDKQATVCGYLLASNADRLPADPRQFGAATADRTALMVIC